MGYTPKEVFNDPTPELAEELKHWEIVEDPDSENVTLKLKESE